MFTWEIHYGCGKRNFGTDSFYGGKSYSVVSNDFYKKIPGCLDCFLKRSSWSMVENRISLEPQALKLPCGIPNNFVKSNSLPILPRKAFRYQGSYFDNKHLRTVHTQFWSFLQMKSSPVQFDKRFFQCN